MKSIHQLGSNMFPLTKAIKGVLQLVVCCVIFVVFPGLFTIVINVALAPCLVVRGFVCIVGNHYNYIRFKSLSLPKAPIKSIVRTLSWTTPSIAIPSTRTLYVFPVRLPLRSLRRIVSYLLIRTRILVYVLQGPFTSTVNTENGVPREIQITWLRWNIRRLIFSIA